MANAEILWDFTSMTSEQLWDFWEEYRHATNASRLAVCGRLGPGTVLQTAAAVNWACNKSVAMNLRTRGDLEAAEVYERICESIARGLPPTIKIT